MIAVLLQGKSHCLYLSQKLLSGYQDGVNTQGMHACMLVELLRTLLQY